MKKLFIISLLAVPTLLFSQGRMVIYNNGFVIINNSAYVVLQNINNSVIPVVTVTPTGSNASRYTFQK